MTCGRDGARFPAAAAEAPLILAGRRCRCQAGGRYDLPDRHFTDRVVNENFFPLILDGEGRDGGE